MGLDFSYHLYFNRQDRFAVLEHLAEFNLGDT